MALSFVIKYHGFFQHHLRMAGKFQILSSFKQRTQTTDFGTFTQKIRFANQLSIRKKSFSVAAYQKFYVFYSNL